MRRNRIPLRDRRARALNAGLTLMAATLSSYTTAVMAATPEVVAAAGPQEVAQFDESLMKQRGLEQSLSNYFQRAPRFLPGATVVSVTVNGISQGRRNVVFDSEGQLCFDANLIRSIGLVEPPQPPLSERCPDYRAFAPRTLITLQPNLSAVDIVTPEEFVRPAAPRIQSESGGRGGLLNYRAFTQTSRFGGESTSFSQIETEAGVNVDDWLFRTRQLYTVNDGVTRFRMQQAYAQTTFADERQVMQAGQIAIQNPLFGGVPIVGAQWFPEYALRAAVNTGANISGIANGRARVEVRQGNALIHSTIVPPGPFTLSGVQTANLNTDLQVRVIEENGAEQAFTVPAATLLLSNDAALEGLSVAAGKLWDAGEVRSIETDWVMSASNGWRWNDALSGTLGGLASSGYQSVGAAARWQRPDSLYSIYAQSLMARDTVHTRSGGQTSAAFSAQLLKGLSFGVAGNVRSRDYVSLQEAKRVDSLNWEPSGYRNQISTNLNWSTGAIGVLSLGLSRETYFEGSDGKRVTLNWGTSLRQATVSVGLTHSTLRSNTNDWPTFEWRRVPISSNSVYVNLSIPLGVKTSVTAYSRTVDGLTRMGSSVDHRFSDQFNVRASADRQTQGGDTSTSLSASVLPRYTSLSVGAGQGSSYQSYYGEMSGGVVIHGGGVAFSPYAVGDTFGLVRVGEVSGIRLNTPQGPVWTGQGGYAPLPKLSAFADARVEVDTKSIPRHVEVQEGLQIVKPSRGAVVHVKMAAMRVRRVLLTVRQMSGELLAAGGTVVNEEGDLVTTTTSQGLLLLPDMKEGEHFSIRQSDGPSCRISNIELSADRDDEYFQRGTAKCLPSEITSK